MSWPPLHNPLKEPKNLLHLEPVVPWHLSAGLTGGLATNIDIKAPGIREQQSNPTLLQVFPLPSALWQHATGTTNLNAPAMLNTGDNLDAPPFLSSQWNRDVGAQWFEVTQQTPVGDWWYTRDLGNFSVPHTGFSALADFRPVSTLGWLF